jgi:hypothetical protein
LIGRAAGTPKSDFGFVFGTGNDSGFGFVTQLMVLQLGHERELQPADSAVKVFGRLPENENVILND